MTALPATTITQIDHCDITKRPVFTAKFSGMRKAQEFIVYAGKADDSSIVIQSETRIGELFLDSGICRLSASFPNGAYFMHLAMAKNNSVVSESDLNEIKKALGRATA